MLKIAHRINTLAQLRDTPAHLGVEIDLRDRGGRIILHHDAFSDGEDFDAWLDGYQHAFMILNTKCEGLENALLEKMAARGIKDFFFLDLSIPFMVKQVRKGVREIAVRFSEYEPAELALRFAGQVEWVWVDCFRDLPLDAAAYALLKPHFRFCLVSPELQGHDPLARIPEFRRRLEGMAIDAVCTKRPDLWA